MNSYFIFAIMFTLGFSILYVPFGYAQDQKNNSFTYYERNCNNDTCTVTTCSADKSCSTTGVNNSTSNNTTEEQAPDEKGNSDPRTLDMTKFWEKFMNFEFE